MSWPRVCLVWVALVWLGCGCGCGRAVGNAADASGELDASVPEAAVPVVDAADPYPDAAEDLCGDGELGPGEECDDGNILDGDGCSAGCLWECDLPGGGCLCDWEELYAVRIYGAEAPPGMLRCPGGSNCVPGDELGDTCTVTAGQDVCRAVSEGYTCSVITGQLMSAPTLSCADVDPSHGCLPIDPAASDPTLTGGTLIGFCQYLPMGPITRELWESCYYLYELCVPDATCLAWGGFDEGWGRCVPWCDTEDPTGVEARCVDTGAPAGAECRSVSLQCDPAPPLPHVRLGLCE